VPLIKKTRIARVTEATMTVIPSGVILGIY